MTTSRAGMGPTHAGTEPVRDDTTSNGAGTPVTRDATEQTRADASPHTNPNDAGTALDRDDTWLPVQDAATQSGVSVGAIRKWARRGQVRSRTAEGPRGERLEVTYADVTARAQIVSTQRPSGPALPPDTLPVPREDWQRVLTSVAHLHEAGQQLAEARERAAKAETEAAFLRERLGELRQTAERDREEAAALRARLLDTPPAEPAPAKPAPRRRRWWGGRA
jgi:hypothetical protein